MTEKMEPWRAKSLKKWDEGVWERLERALKRYEKKHQAEADRGDIFFDFLWIPCGFCEHARGECGNCPLHPTYCTDCIDDSPYPGQMRDAWVEEDRKTFETVRKKLIAVMRKAKFKKEEELPWQS